MKRSLFTLSLFIALFLQVKAQTHISTPTVSGHWTLAGSPYIIHNDISVPLAGSLIIDPGVHVAFDGYYKLTVLGIINATGTAAAPIVFRSFDTTGWSASATVGGWWGMDIGSSGSPSTLVSTTSHCRFQDMRGYGLSVFWRAHNVYNSEFTHNSGRVIQTTLGSDTTRSIGLYNCEIHDNITTGRLTLLTFGGLVINNCHVHHNTSGASTLFMQGCKVTIDSSEIHDNLQTGTSLETTINMLQCAGTIKFNKVHHNTSQYAGAVAVMVGRMEISNNLICNNRTIVGFTGSSACGSVEGGGGIRISGEGGAEPSYFLVRNNVIANNYAALAGGAIYVMFTNATIANNTMVNNKSPWGGALYIFNEISAHPHTRVNVKNNIFKHNVSTDAGTSGLPDTLVAMWIPSGDTLQFEHNVSEHHFTDNYYINWGGTLTPVGDTTTNFATTNPGLIAPTLYANVDEDATTSNFDLLITSPAINRGAVSGASPAAIDHAGNARIQGAAIDAGAYEYGNFCAAALTGPANMCRGTSATFLHPTGGGTWSSYDAPAIISLSSSGTVGATNAGFAVVNYIVGGCLASAVVHIDTIPGAGMLAGASAMCLGSTVTLSPTVAGGTWGSSGVASVAAGVVTATTTGTATISYTLTNYCGTGTATLPMTVNPLPAAITGGTTVCAGNMGSTTLASATTGGTWSSSDITIATVDMTHGVATGHLEGTVTITYTLSTGCYVTHTITSVPCPDGINEVGTKATVKAYPNPVSGQLIVESASSMQRLCIYDLQGRRVYETISTGKQTTIDMSAYNPGIYLIYLGDQPPVKVTKE